MMNNYRYTRCKNEIFEYGIASIIVFVGFCGFCLYFIITPESEFNSSIFLLKLMFKFFGKAGVIAVFVVFILWTGLYCYSSIGSFIDFIRGSKSLPADWEERKLIINREKEHFPKEINQSMLKQIMIVTDLPQQQVESVLWDKSITPEGIIVFPDIECYKYVPVYFDPDNWYLHKNGSTITISVMNNKRLTTYKVEQSEVDFVDKCEKLANDIRKHPEQYQNVQMEEFKLK